MKKARFAITIVCLAGFAYIVISALLRLNFETIYGVSPATYTDTQKIFVQKNVKTTIMEFSVLASDSRKDLLDAQRIDYCRGDAWKVQTCIQTALDVLKKVEWAAETAQNNLNRATHYARLYGYDTSFSTEDMAVYRKATH